MEQHFDLEKHLREDAELAVPSPDFSKKVMGAIDGVRIAPPSRTYIHNKVVYGIGLFFLLLTGAALAWAIVSADWSAAEKFVSSVTFSKLDISRYFTHQSLNSLLFLNVLLGLIFLDKFIAGRRRAL
jgi:hypothetical protein